MFQVPSFIKYHYSPEQKSVIYSILGICTFAMPGLSALYLLKKGIVTSFDIEDRSERWIPYFITFLFYLFAYFFVTMLSIHKSVSAITLGAAIAVFAGMFANTLFKISVHMIAIGGVVGVLAALGRTLQVDVVMWLFVAVFIAGLLGYARLTLKRHTPDEVYLGFMLGFAAEFIAVSLMLG